MTLVTRNGLITTTTAEPTVLDEESPVVLVAHGVEMHLSYRELLALLGLDDAPLREPTPTANR